MNSKVNIQLSDIADNLKTIDTKQLLKYLNPIFVTHLATDRLADLIIKRW